MWMDSAHPFPDDSQGKSRPIVAPGLPLCSPTVNWAGVSPAGHETQGLICSLKVNQDGPDLSGKSATGRR